MKYNGIPTACEAFSYGQVEDYTVNIVSVARENEEITSAAAKWDISVYPNPVKDNLLYISNVDTATYRVISMLGQEISKGNVENGTVPVSNITPGTYLLEVTSNGQSAAKRFIKQ